MNHNFLSFTGAWLPALTGDPPPLRGANKKSRAGIWHSPQLQDTVSHFPQGRRKPAVSIRKSCCILCPTPLCPFLIALFYSIRGKKASKLAFPVNFRHIGRQFAREFPLFVHKDNISSPSGPPAVRSPFPRRFSLRPFPAKPAPGPFPAPRGGLCRPTKTGGISSAGSAFLSFIRGSGTARRPLPCARSR